MINAQIVQLLLMIVWSTHTKMGFLVWLKHQCREHHWMGVRNPPTTLPLVSKSDTMADVHDKYFKNFRLKLTGFLIYHTSRSTLPLALRERIRRSSGFRSYYMHRNPCRSSPLRLSNRANESIFYDTRPFVLFCPSCSLTGHLKFWGFRTYLENSQRFFASLWNFGRKIRCI